MSCRYALCAVLVIYFKLHELCFAWLLSGAVCVLYGSIERWIELLMDV